MKRIMAFLALGLVSTAACDDPFGPASAPDESLPEMHGEPVAGASNVLRWSPSGGEVTYVSADGRTVAVYDVVSGSSRDVYTTERSGERIFDAHLSADGAELFTAALEVYCCRVRRHSAEGTAVLSDREGGHFPVFRTALEAEGSAVFLAPDGATVAFVAAPDSLFLLQRGQDRFLLGDGCRGIVAFAPDGSAVLCSFWSPGTPGTVYHSYPTDGASTGSTFEMPSDFGRTVSVRWTESGVEALRWSFGEPLTIHDVATGGRRSFGPAWSDFEFQWSEGVSWSADGTRVAYWKSHCGQTAGLFSCARPQRLLHTLEVDTGTDTRVAVHSGSTGVATTSPRGAHLAYAINRSLYIVAVDGG